QGAGPSTAVEWGACRPIPHRRVGAATTGDRAWWSCPRPLGDAARRRGQRGPRLHWSRERARRPMHQRPRVRRPPRPAQRATNRLARFTSCIGIWRCRGGRARRPGDGCGGASVSAASQNLHVLADLSRSLATYTDLDALVHYATERVRALFDAEGCALLLLDAERREFCFPVASQGPPGSAAALAEVRFPADRGIAGWVLANDESALVPDVARDPRFYDAVDRQTAMRTRALLCAPLR